MQAPPFSTAAQYKIHAAAVAFAEIIPALTTQQIFELSEILSYELRQRQAHFLRRLDSQRESREKEGSANG